MMYYKVKDLFTNDIKVIALKVFPEAKKKSFILSYEFNGLSIAIKHKRPSYRIANKNNIVNFLIFAKELLNNYLHNLKSNAYYNSK